MEFLSGQVFLRTAVMFMVALVIVRLMGNRTIGQMTPFDYVILVGIGDIVASVALDTQERLWSGAEALLMLLILNFGLSYFSLKNRRFRQMIEGTAIEVIKDGQLIRQNLSKAHFNNDDLKQEMHKLGMDLEQIKNVKQAWLEGCGHFTVIKKQEAEPITLQDMQNIIGTPPATGQLNSTVISQATLEQLVDNVQRLIQELKQQQSAQSMRESENGNREPE